MKPLPLEFEFTPDTIEGDYEPAQHGGWTDPSWPESYTVTAIRIGETWIPAEQLDDVTREELNHYMLAVIRDERGDYEQRLRRAV